MNVFDDLIQIGENGDVQYNSWVEWNHFGIPNKPEGIRNLIRNLMAMLNHCLVCTVIDGCYLLDSNRPSYPLHSYCDCNLIGIRFDKVKGKAKAYMPIEKLTNYIFSGEKNSKGKQALFESWGYSIEDAYFLKEEIEKQARDGYISGKYKMKVLDKFGLRLAIPINLKGHIFNTGWLLCPEGEIKNTTPFGGWTR